MSSKSNIYCCVPGCTQKGTVDPEGNRVGFFGLPNDQDPENGLAGSSSISWSSLRESSKLCLLVRVVDIVLTVGGGRFRGEVRHGNLEGHAPSFKAIFLPPIPLLMSLS